MKAGGSWISFFRVLYPGAKEPCKLPLLGGSWIVITGVISTPKKAITSNNIELPYLEPHFSLPMNLPVKAC